jgi:alpha-galactosidase
MKRRWFLVAIVLFLWNSHSIFAVQPSEKDKQLQWVNAKFEGKELVDNTKPRLVVLANHQNVGRNKRNFDGQPFNISGTIYTKGLSCHAISKIAVKLPSAGKSFSAAVGVDTIGPITSGGRGSIVATVSVNGKEQFNSGLRREGMAAVPVNVDLDGAREFVIAIGDGGDGISCDVTDWVDAKVQLADGNEIWLGDMDIIDNPEEVFSNEPPFSFTYDSKTFSELRAAWDVKRKTRKLDQFRTEHELTYTDPNTGLIVRCVGIEWQDYPTVEWTVYLKNTGSADTPILENIQALDVEFCPNQTGNFILHHANGAQITPNDYEPLTTILGPNTTKRLAGWQGQPTAHDMSYFNLEFPGNRGVVMAIGWPGQWSSNFMRKAEDTGVRVIAGQEVTHFKLHPGEEVRSPLVVLQFWQAGDWIGAQNIWRRWMLAHNVPRPGGKQLEPLLFGTSFMAFNQGSTSTTASEIEFIGRYIEEKLKIDYWWTDAGWYPGETEGIVWPKTGTWEVDTKRFPKGLREISDYVHSNGMKTLLWFEPERVAKGTWLTENHSEWVLGDPNKGYVLLNEGNSNAMSWLLDHFDKLLTTEGIDLYREDFNIEPLPFWRGNDTQDRQGITEIRHVEGHLAYWDALIKRRPNMLIDSCASGGRRNDIETMRRAVPLWRNDWRNTVASMQAMTYGLAFWVPLSGTGYGDYAHDPKRGTASRYDFYSFMVPFLNLAWDMHIKDGNYDKRRRLIESFRQAAKYHWGDYYPLTTYSLSEDQWIAWQFDVPETGEGMVQAFRRLDSSYLACQYKLRGLISEAKYEAYDIDKPEVKTTITGQELMEKGLKVIIDEQPGAVIILYKKVS